MDTSDPGPSIDELRAACTRFLVGHGRYEAGTGESLAEYLVRLNDHLLGDLAVIEVADRQARSIYGRLTRPMAPQVQAEQDAELNKAFAR
jgi:hypothetical protein